MDYLKHNNHVNEDIQMQDHDAGVNRNVREEVGSSRKKGSTNGQKKVRRLEGMVGPIERGNRVQQ